MYSIILCAAVALAISLIVSLPVGFGWVGGTFLFTAVFVGLWIFLTRRFARLLQPKMEAVRKQAEQGQIAAARESLAALLPMGRWVPLLQGQIHSQLGMLALHAGEESKAIEHLNKSSRRVAEGQLMLASMHYRKQRKEEALKVMASAAPFQRKHSLFQNVYAHLLEKEGRLDEAIARLNTVVKKVPDDRISKDNLLRLQNRQRMDLRVFGNEWFALGFERPPTSMGELRTVRKGFRQPPKGPRQTPKKKKFH